MTLAKVLITRPREEAETLASALAARGLEPLVEPLFEIRWREAALPDLARFQALLCTSANGVRALARETAERGLPLFAVGEATANRARALGFTAVESAQGNVADLVRLVADRLDPKAGALLHAAGSEVAGDLAGDLQARGFAVERAVLYEAHPVAALSPAAVDALQGGEVGFALFFSPRTAAVFARLAADAGVVDACAAMTSVSISAAADAALGDLPWHKRCIAASPDQAAVLASIDAARSPMSDTGSEAPLAAEPVTPAEPSVIPPPPPPSSPRLTWWLVVVLIAAAGAVGFGLGYALESLMPPAPAQQQLAALTERVAALENRIETAAQPSETLKALQQRLDRLEAAAQGAHDPGPQLQQLAGRLETLEKQVAGLGGGEADAAKTQQELARLDTAAGDVEKRLGAVEKQLAAQAKAAEDAAPLLASLLRIRSAIDAARPFSGDFAAVKAAAKDRPEIAAAAAPLEAAAAGGVPTRAALQQGLDALAEKLAAGTPAPSGGDWKARTWARLSGLVTIRRIDSEAEADAPQAAVGAARRSLAAGDLAAAIVALKPLSGGAADAAQPWLRQANQRLAVETALERLQQLATAPPAGHPPS